MRNYCLAAAKWPSRRPLVHSRHTVREAHHVHHSALDVTRGTAASRRPHKTIYEQGRAGGLAPRRGGARRRKRAGASRHTGVVNWCGRFLITAHPRSCHTRESLQRTPRGAAADLLFCSVISTRSQTDTKSTLTDTRSNSRETDSRKRTDICQATPTDRSPPLSLTTPAAKGSSAPAPSSAVRVLECSLACL